MAAQKVGFCDPKTGLCTPAPINEQELTIDYRTDVEIVYVGDPMCSWCWGISPQLNRLEREAAQENIPYRIVLGGLRPGGGDPWNDQFKDFLKHHWEEVNDRSGQPFGYDLFEKPEFNYDTEPACRAVVAAREMKPEIEQRFFELVQHHFYVKNQDPAAVTFYQPICETLGLDFDEVLFAFSKRSHEKSNCGRFPAQPPVGSKGLPHRFIEKRPTTLCYCQRLCRIRSALGNGPNHNRKLGHECC